MSERTDRGEVMLEGMIIVILTIFLLCWILGVGFLYYQRYTVSIVTSDAATKIASTYNNPTSDIIMGYVATEELRSRDLYRGYPYSGEASNLQAVNEDRAEAYVKYMLDRTNFVGTVKDVEVTLKMVPDSYARRHVELTTRCEFRTPFGDFLRYFGMGRRATYEAIGCADCTDLSDYIVTTNYAVAWTDGTFTSGMGIVNDVVKLINSLVTLYNHQYT